MVKAAPYPLFVYDMGLARGDEVRSERCVLALAHDMDLHQSQEVQSLTPELQTMLINTQIENEKEMPPCRCRYEGERARQARKARA